MSYNEGIRIDDLHSNADFDLVINSRQIGLPSKNSVRKTIPFMSGFYDFSMLGGGTVWGERIISYTFDIVGATVAEMDRKRTEVINWLCNLHDVDIYDDTIPEYHFHGSYNDNSQNEDGEKTELTVSFVCYPFMIKNEPQEITAYQNGSYKIFNNGQTVFPSVSTLQNCTVKIGKYQQEISAAADYKTDLELIKGENSVEVTKNNEIPYPYHNKTMTSNGIKFTDNGDGTITVTGTATGKASFWLQQPTADLVPPIGKHLLSGCPHNESEGNCCIRYCVYNSDGNKSQSIYYYDYGEGVIVDISKDTKNISAVIFIEKGYKAENIVFSPEMHGETVLKWTEEVL